MILQDEHIDELNKAFAVNPHMTGEQKLSVLQMWIREVPAGSVTLAQIMHGQPPDLEDGA